MSITRRDILYPNGHTDGYQLIRQPYRTPLGGIAAPEKNDDAVPLDYLETRLAGIGPGGTGDEILKNGSVDFTANQSMGGNLLTDLADAIDLNDAVNLQTLQNSLPVSSEYQSISVGDAFANESAHTWTHGYYKITGLYAVSGFFTRTYLGSDGHIHIYLTGPVEFQDYSNARTIGVGTIDLGAEALTRIVCRDNVTGINQDLSANGYVIEQYQWILNNPNFAVIKAYGLVLDVSLVPDSSTIMLTNIEMSYNDEFRFTENNQVVYGLNAGNNRFISFDSRVGLSYNNCAIGSGKAITIYSSQYNATWINDVDSTFMEIIDFDIYHDNIVTVNLGIAKHAGIIYYVSGGFNTVPSIGSFTGWGNVLKKKMFADPGACNPGFKDGNPDIKFGVVWVGYSTHTLSQYKDFIEIESSSDTPYFYVTNLNAY